MPSKYAKSIYVLVIEDDQELREFLADQLIDQGYKVMTADNGAEAVECIQNSKFHVVISDIRMPGMDGLETMEAIHKIDPSVQIIVVSGQGHVDTVMDAMRKGAYHFLHKPIALADLFVLVEKAYEVSKGSSASAKFEDLLETLMNRLLAALHADGGSFMLMDSANCLYIASSKGLSEEMLYSTVLTLGERIAGLAAKNNRKFLINGNLERYPEFEGIQTNPRIASSLIVPVFNRDKLIGVLNLNRHLNSQNFTEDDLENASKFVSEMAEAIQNAKLLSDLEEQNRQIKPAFKKNP